MLKEMNYLKENVEFLKYKILNKYQNNFCQIAFLIKK